MRLTDRDFDLLRYLAEQGVASSKQLADKFFPNRHAFRSRIHVLIGAALVESMPLTDLKGVSQ